MRFVTRSTAIQDRVAGAILDAATDLLARGGEPPSMNEVDPLAHHGILAGEAARLQFLQGAFRGEIRVLGEQFLQDRLERVDEALAPAWPGQRCTGTSRPASSCCRP